MSKDIKRRKKPTQLHVVVFVDGKKKQAEFI